MLTEMSKLAFSQLEGGDRTGAHNTVTYFVFVTWRLLVFYDKLPPV